LNTGTWFPGICQRKKKPPLVLYPNMQKSIEETDSPSVLFQILLKNICQGNNLGIKYVYCIYFLSGGLS
jgi:hypothetical protein